MNNKIKCDNNKFKYLNEWIRKKNNIDLMNKYIYKYSFSSYYKY